MQELLKPLRNGLFSRIVNKANSDKHNKRFSSWQHMVAMVYAQLTNASSLRTLASSYNQHSTAHYHLNTAEIKRSTLAQANANRNPAVFADTVTALISQAQRHIKRECNEMLYLLDSSPISLKGMGFDDWTTAHKTSRTQGLKLHLVYDMHSQTPIYHDISVPNINDITAAQEIPIQSGATYVFDKGYCDYAWWNTLNTAGAQFVTRFKSNAALNVLQINICDDEHILADEHVTLRYASKRKDRKQPYQGALRRIEVLREGKEPLVLATNDMTSSAAVIALRYKNRWQIELFFKWIKQHLKIKSFLGRTENAVKIQLYCALIAYLLLLLYKQANGLTISLWQLLAQVANSLFQRPEFDLHAKKKRLRRYLVFEKQGVLQF
jgi:IS4 transposase